MKTFICIASGPSLLRSDCIIAAQSGHQIIAINSSWKIAPECHYLFAADFAWWQQYHDDIDIPAQRWTVSARAKNCFGVNIYKPPSEGAFNSGQRAIQLAAYLGASRIILLGYDCTLENGAHWHGEHPDGMHNPIPGEVERWHTDFSLLVDELPGVEIINCSRRSALTCFPQQSPETIFHV